MSNSKSEPVFIGRYISSGALNTIVGFAVIYLLMALGVTPIISNIAGYSVGLMLAFMLSRSFVFRSEGHIAAEGVRFLIAFAISYAVNMCVLVVALELLNISKEMSQLLAAITYTGVMYILSRNYIFTSRT